MLCFKSWIFVAAVILSSMVEAQPLKVEVSAKAAILLNAETGAVLFEKNAHQSLHPASITKMITLMYALEKKGHALQEPVQASYEAVAAVHPHVRRASTTKHPPYRLEFGGSHMNLKAGEVLPFEALLYGLMLSSGNDAANAIAQYVSGDIPQFIEELNAYIKSKGCLNTVLYTPHGLPHSEHKTSAYDMAILAKEALKNPKVCEIVKAGKYTRPASNMQPESILQQHNALLKPGGKFYYPKAIGIKTGYTIAAGYTIVAAAQDPQRKLVAVLLGCEHLEQRYKDAIALFETAFNEKMLSRILYSKDFDFFTCPVKGGKMPIEASLAKDVVVEYFPSEDQAFEASVAWDQHQLPILQGQKVGEVHIQNKGGQRVLSSSLYAVKPVEPTFGHAMHLKWMDAKGAIKSRLPVAVALLGITVVAGTFFIYHEISGKQRRRKRDKN